MTTKNKLVVVLLCFYAFLVSLAFVFNLGLPPKIINDQISMTRMDLEELNSKGKVNSSPMSFDNLLVYSARINQISSSLNQAIEKSKLNLPPVKLYNSGLSYKTPGRSWMAVGDNLIIVYLYYDVSNILDSNEVLASAVHELGHAVLGHKKSLSIYERNINYEIDADKFAVESGIDPKTLISAINKLAAENEEKTKRVTALTGLETN